ncbi:MAG: FAD-dependent monooxygenase [Burkholderiales bacterium]|nr:FAD-dependent monooxygenase [Burkholderiales bacterium]
MARILVVGGSLGGLMAANLLLRAGHDVQVLERSGRCLEGRGAGIVTHDTLRQALREAGAVVDAGLGVAVRSRVALGVDGEVVGRWDYPQVLTSWGRLYTLLRDALPTDRYRLGAQVVQVTQSDDHVDAELATGTRLHADLLIAADGVRSGVRAQLAPAVTPVYAGYVAWRGVCDEASLSRRTRETLFPHFGFGLPEREQLIGYPVAGGGNRLGAGERAWNFVWYRPAAQGAELAALLTDADGVPHPEGIAPQQVSWRQIAAMRQAARERLAPQFAEIVEKTAQPFVQPIVDLVSPQLAFGRIALLGDAAMVARPHVGMGVTKAGDDARALAASIAEFGATPAALARYAALRQPIGAAVVERGRQLGAYLQARSRTSSEPVAERSVEAVLRQTAVDPLLFGHAFESPAPHASAA